ncbi:uncharacterized protein DFL_005973 [Arthrobotrys flagrans]|uniref:alcohol dehydrogenase (NADP(+)) n=1 Tax=Arthrobotrys flagrans TaxID=97331 RepID=A0A436ZYV3_ARTFL|nr:hypothetical protein DFL_005973 [Arthrobotrys flagrans]
MAKDTFNGWVGKDLSAADGNLVWEAFTPKTWEETDIDIEVTHCGMCGSDVHTLRGGWHKPEFPYVVGHEIVGRAIRVGSKVTGIKVGDRVGVGAQSDSCLECNLCKTDNEPYCPNFVQTYDMRHKNGDRTMGGYADYARVPGHFAINLTPYPNIPSEILAPMLCGGVTMFSPLKRYGAGPGKKVGIIGLGGLGHFGVMWAKALRADEVVVISRSRSKEEDAFKIGATKFIATKDEPDWATKYEKTIDLIVNTVDSVDMPLQEYLGLLAPMGTMVQIGAPEGNLPSFNAFALFFTNRSLTATAIGSRKEIREALQLANDKGLKTWANPFPMSQVNEAIKAFNRSEARYRIVLVNEKHLQQDN